MRGAQVHAVTKWVAVLLDLAVVPDGVGIRVAWPHAVDMGLPKVAVCNPVHGNLSHGCADVDALCGRGVRPKRYAAILQMRAKPRMGKELRACIEVLDVHKPSCPFGQTET